MSTLDKFIEHATTGLPRSERLEARAELRTNLNELVARLMADGLQREEAEHVAIQKMGHSARVNRGFLGHVFTARLGWRVLAVLVLLVAAWLVSDMVLRPVRVQHLRVTDVSVKRLLNNSSRFLVTLPRDAGDVFVGVNHPWGSGIELVTGLERDPNANPGFQFLRRQLEVVPGELAVADPKCSSEAEAGLSLLILSGRPGGSMQENPTCSPAPAGYLYGGWRPIVETVETDTWMPIGVFIPTIEGPRRNPTDTSDAYGVERLAAEDSWVVLSVWIGREVAEPDWEAKSPGIAYLRDKYRGVFLELDEQEGRR